MDTTLLHDGAEAMKEFVNGVMADKLNTACPGEIVMFDPALQTAVVKCCVKKAIILDNGERKTMERCGLVDVPVLFPYSTSTGFAITYPIEKGDQCLLLFSQEGLDVWQEYGSVQDPPGTGAARHFDYTDAIAIVGLIPKPNAIPMFQLKGIDIRSKNRAVHYYLDGSQINEQVLKGANTFTRTIDGVTGTVNELLQAPGGSVSISKTNGSLIINASVAFGITSPTITIAASTSYSLTTKNMAVQSEQAAFVISGAMAITAGTFTVATEKYYVTANGVVAASGYIALADGAPFTGITKTGNGDTTLAFVHGICVRFGNT